MKQTRKIYVEGQKLEDNEYLLKTSTDWKDREKGFLTKFNKDGSMPVKFKSWSESPIWVVNEDFSSGWKVVDYRHGKSQNWAVLLHPSGYRIEIYMENLFELFEGNSILGGIFQGRFKWEAKKLIKSKLQW